MDKMREEFEKFYSKEFGCREDNPESMFETFCDDGESHEYYRLGVRVAWITWQASRAALCVDLPKRFSDERKEFSSGFDVAVEHVMAALHESGVRYK